MPLTADPSSASNAKRYTQLAIIIVAAGVLYPLLYLRQNFEVSILEAFGITAAELGQCYTILGVMFTITYVPGGWLADRVSPRGLMTFSLLLGGLLGVWFSTMPDLAQLRLIFAGWGIATGLTFWSAMIKAVAVLAKPSEQGRFFGVLDGGRGLVEAFIATLVMMLFAYWLNGLGESTEIALQKVIWIYSGLMLFLAPIVWFVIDDFRTTQTPDGSETGAISFWRDVGVVLRKREIWLAAFCILTGYQLFWATYSFSAYMQNNFGMTAVAVGSITVAKLWMRPIGAATAGFASDFMNRETVLGWLLLAAAVALALLAFVPVGIGIAMLFVIVLVIGILTYAVRGIYWSTLDGCNVDTRIKGLAIGVMSFIGYSPDIYLPQIYGALIGKYPGKTGYVIYFLGISIMGVLGAFAAWRLKVVIANRDSV